MLRRTVRQRANGLKDFSVRREEAGLGLRELMRELRLEKLPRVIETFDISNISGTSAVASMVCSVDGVPCRQRYRRFRIKTVEGANDPAMMREAVTRRYRRLLDEKLPLPDLVVFDGGITQLRAGREALDGLGLQALRGVGLAKRFEEIVWDVTNRSPPLRLPLDSPALRILQNIRDEAHRFALDYHRLLRARRIRESALDDIPGIGDARKMALLRHFGSVDRLRRATRESIREVPGVGSELADLIFQTLRPQPARPTP
ncbi:MAG: helix-hairpin-helix domain-containing protein [Kiritimatiellia bacterium]